MRYRKLPISIPLLGEAEEEAAKEAIASGWITQGPRVLTFETMFSDFVGAKYACAVSSCTAALHLALLAVGVRPGDTVITVSHSFIATANAIRACGADPVFIDIETKTFNMCPGSLDNSLTNEFETRDGELWYQHVDKLLKSEQSPLHYHTQRFGRLGAILVPHQIGMPADLEKILASAKQFNLPVVEDAACAIGSEIRFSEDGNWETIGKPHGDIACFSFHPRKVITTGDGGMLTTNNALYDKKFRLLRQHGMDISDAQRHDVNRVVFENYLLSSFNYRLTDIQAAVGIEQLKRLPSILEKRRELAEIYKQHIDTIPEISYQMTPDFAKTNWQSFAITLSKSLDQIPLMQSLLDQGISTKPGVMCAHLEKPYSDAWPKPCLENSEFARKNSIMLPLYPAMNEADITRVITSLKKAISST